MNRLSRHIRRAGPRGFTLATLLVSAFFLSLSAATDFNPPEEGARVAADVVDSGLGLGLDDPPYLTPTDDDLAVGVGMIPPGLGAAPNTTYPRFSSSSTKTEFKLADAFSLRGTHEPQAIVIHVGAIEGTRSDACDGLANYLRSNERRVSAHFVVCNEKIVQQVEIADAAHHAGRWGTPTLSIPLVRTWWQRHLVNPVEGNPNLETIGIETPLTWGNIVTADPTSRWAELRLNLIELLVWLNKNTGIPLDRLHVIGHFETDGTTRSGDPTCCLDIDEIVATAAGIANGPEPNPTPGSAPTPEPLPPAIFPFYDGDRHVFEGGRENGWSWDPDPAPWGVWYYKNIAIFDRCDPTWDGRRSVAGIWDNVGDWNFYESVNAWIQSPPC